MLDKKFNLSKGEEKKVYDLSKKNEPKINKFDLSKDQTNVSTSSNSSSRKKNKPWIWILIGLVAIVLIVFLVKNILPKTGGIEEQGDSAPEIENEMLASIDESTEKIEDLETKVAEPQIENDNTKSENATPTKPNYNQTSTDKPISKTNSSSPSNIPMETLEQKAIEVIKGIYGNGIDRQNALGDEYNAIQIKVNEMYRNGEVI